MATLIVKFKDLSQYNAKAATIVWRATGPKRWIDIYSNLKIGDNCIFISDTQLFVGLYHSSVEGSSLKFDQIKVTQLSTDEFLRIDIVDPETLAQIKRPRGPILKNTIDINAVFKAAVDKKFISFYIVKEKKAESLLKNLNTNDRVVTVDENDKIIGWSTMIDGVLNKKSLGDEYFNAEGKTLQEILSLANKADRPNHVRNIERIMVALENDDYYKFPSYNNYYNVIHNKRLYAAGQVEMGAITYDEPDEFENDHQTVTKMSLNQILYGPPGTGKTFHSISYAVAIVENKASNEVIEEANIDRLAVKKRFDEYVESGLIVFTTFHQSLSYEDFIEGIKPLPPEKDQDIKYDIKDGIFKDLCSEAESNWFSSTQKNGPGSTFENAFVEMQEQWETDKNIKFGMKTPGKEFTITGFTNKAIYFKKASGGVGHTLSIKTLKDIYYGKREAWENGVGIYYPGILDKLKAIASSSKGELTRLQNYVIIIDEINRGNVSQVFGELITLIEDDKRIGQPEALKVTLPYSGDPFGVPPNVYIIGTMNTADRSVEALDTALRRRFSFIPKMPEEHKLRVTDDGINLAKVLTTINTRLRVLKDNDHTIGHAWLWNVTNTEELKKVFENKILPLLQEYFYNDYEKLGLVLGDDFFRKSEQINSNIFAAFSGGNGLAGQYDQSWQYQLKSAKNLKTKDFIKLETLIAKPASNEAE